ncbi:MAG TPA: hypothetical protein VGB93_03790 [Methylovirgula sp.]
MMAFNRLFERKNFRGATAELGPICGMCLCHLAHSDFETAALDRKFGPQMVSVGQNFFNGERNLRFQPAACQAQRAAPERRRKSKRHESCHQEPKRKDHCLFNHAASPAGLSCTGL